MTIEREFEDGPGAKYLPKGAKFMCDNDGYFDLDIPNSTLNRWDYDTNIDDAPNKLYDVNYTEGVLVGYRWYDTKNIEPLFPFGFGLSYTSFEINDGTLSADKVKKEETLRVSVKVKNTGAFGGFTTIQLYVGENTPSVVRPQKELKAFKKVYLKVGEEKLIDLYLEKEAFSFGNPETKAWDLNAGLFNLYIGQSSQDITSTLSVNIK